MSKSAAQRIVERLGRAMDEDGREPFWRGAHALAAKLDLNPSSIWRWTRSEIGIPKKHIDPIIAEAARLGITLRYADFHERGN